MSRSHRAWTKALAVLFATSALSVSLCADPARAGSASGLHSAPSTTDPNRGSEAALYPGAVREGER